jgi:hypothetical protein
MAYKIAGGTKWWQVRAGEGVEAEWIVMKKDWKEAAARDEAGLKGKMKNKAKGKGRDKDKGKGKAKKHEEAAEKVTASDSPEGMVGEDGGEDENGDCASLFLHLRYCLPLQLRPRWTSCGVCCIVSDYMA